MSDESEESFPSMTVKREDIPKQVFPPDFNYRQRVISVKAQRTKGGGKLPAGILGAMVQAEIVDPPEQDGVDTKGMRTSCWFTLGTESDPSAADPQSRTKNRGFAQFTNFLEVLGLTEWDLAQVPELATGREFISGVKSKISDDGFSNVNFMPPDADRPKQIGPIGSNGAVAPSKSQPKVTAPNKEAPAAEAPVASKPAAPKKGQTINCEECNEQVPLAQYAKHKATVHPEE